MQRRIVETDTVPKPAGVYSQGVQWDKLVFTAGQVAIDPATGPAVAGGVREQACRVLQNVWTVLEASGAGLDSVVKTTCFLAHIEDFGAFNEVYREFFPTDPPARSTIQAGIVVPWLVEVEAIAVRRER